MSDRAHAWCWVAVACVALAIESAIRTFWPHWYPMVRYSHWVAIAMAAYYFGRTHARKRQEPHR